MSKLRVFVAVCAYSSPALITRFWESLRPEFDDDRMHLSLLLFQHGKWGDVGHACKDIWYNQPAKRPHESILPVQHIECGNRGLARSWNEGIEYAYEWELGDVLIIANDDVEFAPGDIYKMAIPAAYCPPDVYAVFATGQHDLHGPKQPIGHSLFAYTKPGYRTLGYFDENFFPAYCEDQDLSVRAKLAGKREIAVDLGVRHTGSAHVRGVDVPEDRIAAIRTQNGITQRRNQEYLELKWPGFHAGKVEVNKPFGDERFYQCLIPYEDRHAPYPGYNRTDFERLVKL